MIQRIQTIYLLLAAVLVSVANFFPFAHCFVGKGFYTISSLGVSPSGLPPFEGTNIWSWIATAISIAAVVLLLSAIFGYKDRIEQMRKCVYAILLLLAYYIFFGIQVWTVTHVTGIFPSLGLIAELPLIAIILIFLAGRAIKRDEDMVRAADRIR